MSDKYTSKHKSKNKRKRERSESYENRKRIHRKKFMSDSRNLYEYKVREYEETIKSGPTHVCVSCGQLFNKIGIKTCDLEKCRKSIDETLLSRCMNEVGYNDGPIQFCITCHNGFFKLGLIPRLCLVNGLRYPEIPDELKGLSRLEGFLVSQVLIFMRISELRPTRQLRLSGNIVNVPIPIEKSIDILPRSFDKSSIIQLVLKRALQHKSHYIKEYVRPFAVYKAAEYLIQQPLLREENIKLDPRWLIEHAEDREEFVVDNRDIEALEKEEENSRMEKEDKWDETTDEDIVNPALDETLLKEEIYFAPGENCKPISVTSDPYLEEKAFPLIHCGQKFESAVKISYNDRVKSEIRRFDRRSCVPDKLFAMMRKKEIIMLDNSIGIYCKMISNSQMTVTQALDKDFVENLIRNDDAYQVLSTDRLSPVYWSRKKRELMAMIRTLGIPTFFLTLSAAETRWPELLVLLVKVLKKQDISEEQALEMSFAEKCQLIRDDPVTCSRYFDRRIRELFKLLKCENGPFRRYKLVDLYIRIEFQHRGSPHVHSLLWLEGTPKYDSTSPQSKVACEEFIEEFITSSPESLRPDLYGLQIHRHTQSCKRMKGDSVFVCRFGIPHYPMPKTVILEPLKKEELSDEEIDEFPALLDRVQSELSTIAGKLNDKKGKYVIPSFEQFLHRLGCSYEVYERLIRSTLVRGKVFLRRSLSEIRTNGFNREILSRHRANMDLQFVLDPYATVHYILDYINKSNRGMSRLMRDVVQECKEGHLTHRQKLYKISSKFINCSEVSAQEAVYILLSMQLSMSSRSSIFVNTGEKAERVRRLRSEKELKEMDPESADAMMDGLLEYYANRPDTLNHICLAEFASMYDYSKRKTIKILDEANDECSEPFREESNGKSIPLMGNKGHVKPRKVAKIIRYRKYNPSKDLTNYMREKVMLYIPWRDEDNELINVDIQRKYESSLELIKTREKNFVHDSKYDYEDIEKNLESENKAEYLKEQEDLNEDNEFQILDQVRNELNFESEYMDVSSNKAVAGTLSCPRMIADDTYYQLICWLNGKQREFLLGLINHVKHSTDPFYYFLTGGAGTGKSVTINAVYQTLIRWFAKQPDLRNIDNPTVLLTGPTGKSAFNIGGMTLHSALGLSVSQSQKSQKKMSDELKSKMRNKLWNLKILIIDEVSMVGATTLHKVNDKLREIFERDIPFAGISILFVGDFNQLKPVCDRYIFESSNASDYAILAGRLLWEPVKFYRLTECMRQRDDLSFALALNNLAVGRQTEEDVKLFQSRLYDEKSPDLPPNAIRLYPMNVQVDRYNEKVLRIDNGNHIFLADAKDFCPHRSRKIRAQSLAIVANLTTQETYGLPKQLVLKIGVRYMVTVNIDTEDGLVNGSSGVLRHIDMINVNGVLIIQRLWIDFENPNIGRKVRSSTSTKIIDGNDVTPLNRIAKDIPTKSGSIFVFVTRTQFPLVVAEALTIHKSQGQTYDTVVVSVTSKLDLQLMYTAFSRAKSANGLFLLGREIRFPSERSISHKISKELQRLETTCSLEFELPFVSGLEKPNGILVLFFQNLPYLAKHRLLLESDPDINGSDVLFFVETHSNNVAIKGFNQIGENSQNRTNGSLGISVYIKPDIIATADVLGNFGESTAHLEYIRVTVSPGILIYIIYASPKFPKKDTIVILENLAIEGFRYSKRVVIIGDLNIQSNSDNGTKLINMMLCHGFELMVKFGAPSTDNGTQIDYIFASSRFLTSAYHESLISDHKPIISLMNFK